MQALLKWEIMTNLILDLLFKIKQKKILIIIYQMTLSKYVLFISLLT